MSPDRVTVPVGVGESEGNVSLRVPGPWGSVQDLVARAPKARATVDRLREARWRPLDGAMIAGRFLVVVRRCTVGEPECAAVYAADDTGNLAVVRPPEPVAGSCPYHWRRSAVRPAVGSLCAGTRYAALMAAASQRAPVHVGEHPGRLMWVSPSGHRAKVSTEGRHLTVAAELVRIG